MSGRESTRSSVKKSGRVGWLWAADPRRRGSLWSLMVALWLVPGVLAIEAGAMERALPERGSGSVVFDQRSWVFGSGERLVGQWFLADREQPVVVCLLQGRDEAGVVRQRLAGLDPASGRAIWEKSELAWVEAHGAAWESASGVWQPSIRFGVLVVEPGDGRAASRMLDPFEGTDLTPPAVDETWHIRTLLGRSEDDRSWWVLAERAEGERPAGHEREPAAASRGERAGTAWRMFELQDGVGPRAINSIAVRPLMRLPDGNFLVFSDQTREYLSLSPVTGQPSWRRSSRTPAARVELDGERLMVFATEQSRVPFIWDSRTGRDRGEIVGFHPTWRWLGEWQGGYLLSKPDQQASGAEWLELMVRPNGAAEPGRSGGGSAASSRLNDRARGLVWKLQLDEGLLGIRDSATGLVVGVVSTKTGFGVLLDHDGPQRRLLVSRNSLARSSEVWLTAGSVGPEASDHAGNGSGWRLWLNGGLESGGLVVLDLDVEETLGRSDHWTAGRLMGEGGLVSLARWVVELHGVEGVAGSSDRWLSAAEANRRAMTQAVVRYALGRRDHELRSVLRSALMDASVTSSIDEWCALFDWLAEEPENHRYIAATPFTRLFHADPMWRSAAAGRLVRLIRKDTPLTFPAEARRRWWEAIGQEVEPSIARLLTEGWLGTFGIEALDRRALIGMLEVWGHDAAMSTLLAGPLLTSVLSEADLDLVLPLLWAGPDVREMVMARLRVDAIGQEAAWRLLMSERFSERQLGMHLVGQYQPGWTGGHRSRVALRLAELMDQGEGRERVAAFERWSSVEIADQAAVESLRKRLADPLFARRTLEILKALERQGTVAGEVFDDLVPMLARPPSNVDELRLQRQVLRTMAAMGRNPLVRNRVGQTLRRYAYADPTVEVALKITALEVLPTAGLSRDDFPRLREQMLIAPIEPATKAMAALFGAGYSLEKDLMELMVPEDAISSWRALQLFEGMLVLRHQASGGSAGKVEMVVFPGLAVKLAEIVERCDERVAAKAEMFLLAMGVQAAPAVPVYSRMLAGSDRRRAMHGLKLLEHVGPSARFSGPTVLAMITGREDHLRGFGLEVMRRLGPLMEELAPTVAESLRRNRRLIPDIEPWVRALLSAAPEDEAVIGALLSILDEGTEAQQAIAARELGRLRRLPASSAPTLEKLLASQNVQVRMLATSALGRLGNHAASALPKIEQLQADSDMNVRLRAQHSAMLIRRAMEAE